MCVEFFIHAAAIIGTQVINGKEFKSITSGIVWFIIMEFERLTMLEYFNFKITTSNVDKIKSRDEHSTKISKDNIIKSNHYIHHFTRNLAKIAILLLNVIKNQIVSV